MPGERRVRVVRNRNRARIVQLDVCNSAVTLSTVERYVCERERRLARGVEGVKENDARIGSSLVVLCQAEVIVLSRERIACKRHSL